MEIIADFFSDPHKQI